MGTDPSPAGAYQWKPKDGAGAGTVPDPFDKSKRHAPSINATPKSLWNLFKTKSKDATDANRLKPLMSTMEDEHWERREPHRSAASDARERVKKFNPTCSLPSLSKAARSITTPRSPSRAVPRGARNPARMSGGRKFAHEGVTQRSGDGDARGSARSSAGPVCRFKLSAQLIKPT